MPLTDPLTPNESELALRSPNSNIKDRDIIDYYELYVQTNNRVPTLDTAERDLKVPLLELLTKLDSPTIREAFDARGILPFDTSTKGISPMQLASVALVFDFNDFRPLAHKLKQLGITTRQWNGWIRSNSRFASLVHHRAEAAFKEALPTAQSGLYMALQRGDSSALRLYFEVMGYTKSTEAISQVQVELLNTFLSRVIELVTRNTALDQRKAILDDLETLMSGLNISQAP